MKPAPQGPWHQRDLESVGMIQILRSASTVQLVMQEFWGQCKNHGASHYTVTTTKLLLTRALHVL